MKDAFSAYHPSVNFLYFGLVLLFSMCFMHPLCLMISLTAAFSWSVYLNGKRAVRFNLLFLLPAMLVMALVNPVFCHEGVTILAYLPNGNPLTLEAIVYGFASAALLASVMCWFSCYNAVMTSDKFVCLFGRIIPSLSLLLSMCLRFVPKFKAQIKEVSNAQRCVGRDASNGKLLLRARHAIHILSIMVTWSLENAIETADSMKSRAYGLPGRTAFSIYRFDSRDKGALCLISGLGVFIIAMTLAGGFYCRYFPSCKVAAWNAFSISGFLAYLLLCTIPLIIDLREDYRWKIRGNQ